MRKITKSSFYARAPVMGAAFGLLLVLGSIVISAHGFLAFFSLEGLMIVVGGVMAVAFMSFQASDVHKALSAISTMLKESSITHEDLRSDTMNIIEMGASGESKRECVRWRPVSEKAGSTIPLSDMGSTWWSVNTRRRKCAR